MISAFTLVYPAMSAKRVADRSALMTPRRRQPDSRPAAVVRLNY
jgi:hypothetical protein